jgi:hypothetical protein
MGRQTNPITSNDLAHYGQCSLCKMVFKTEGVSKSKLIQVYESHCKTKGHQLALAAEEVPLHSDHVDKLREQNQKLILIIKQFNDENKRLEERCKQMERNFKRLQEDLFGKPNKHGKNNEEMLKYKSLSETCKLLSERISALEQNQFVSKKDNVESEDDATVASEDDATVASEDDATVATVDATVASEDDATVESEDDEQNEKEYNPHYDSYGRNRNNFYNTYEIPKPIGYKIDAFKILLEDRDNENQENIEEIHDEIVALSCWIKEKKKEVKCNEKKVDILLNDLEFIDLELYKLLSNWKNTNYQIPNEKIEKIDTLLKKFNERVWTYTDLK